MDERLYWIWLAEALGQGSVWASLLIRKYGGARAIYEGGPDLPEPDGEIRENIASMLRRKMKNRSLRRICSTESRSGSGQQKRKPSRLRTSFSYRITGRSPQILRKAYRLKRPAAVSRTAASLQALLLFLPGAERLLPGPPGEICSPWCTETAVL